MPGISLWEFSFFKSSNTEYLSSIRRCLSKQGTLLLFATLQVHFPSPFLKGLQTLQALNHVTIIPAKRNWRALPWVPINTCYLISQRGCWWLMVYSSIQPSSLLPQRLYHHCSHPSLGSESNRDRATEIHTIVQSWNLLVVNSQL